MIIARGILIAISAVTVYAALGSERSQAVGSRYPFCIQGDEYPGLSNCTFSSYPQCQATASGRRLTCIENPYFVADGDGPRGLGRSRTYIPSRY